MLTPKKALAAARVYTQETAQEMGALKGAPCTIKSIVKSGNLNTVTFEWTDRSGVTHESTMLVYDGTPGQDGDDGFSPTIVVKSSTSTEYILTITDKNGSYDTPNLKGSGGGGGASAMSDLTDVDLTALANGSVLVYDSTSAKWEATALSLSDISGIDLTGITDGQILAWDAANNKFVPADNTGEEYTAGEGIEISQDNEISSKIVMYTGTKAAWDVLPLADKKKYTHASFTDDTESGVVDSEPTEDSVNLVTSGGVFAALEEKADSATTLAGYGITDAYTKTETNNAITAEIEKLDVSDAAVAGSYVTEVSEADGKISVVREAADAVPTESSNKMVKSGGVYAADKAIYEVMGALGAKNLLLFNLEKIKEANTSGTWAGNVYSIDGLSATFNSDGSISLSGTTSEWRAIKLVTPSFFEVLPADAYTLTGCPSGGSLLTYGLIAQFKDGATNKTLNDYGSGATDTYGTNVSLTGGNVFVSLYPNIDFTGFTFKPMLRLASDTDSTYQPYSKTNQQLTDDSVTWKANGILGAKNLIPFPYPKESDTVLGIDFTTNSNGEIIASGTSTGIAVYDVVNTELYGWNVPREGIYILSDGLSDADYEYAYTAVTFMYNDGTIEYNVGDTSIGRTVIAIPSNLKNFYVGCCIRIDKTVSNIKFKPMLRMIEDSDETFRLYAKTNRELTADTTSLLDNLEVNGAVNMLPNNATTQTTNGVTFTVNPDGSVTVNGTATATTELSLYTNSDGSPELVGKTVKMSGCPSGGDSSSTYSIQAYRVGTTDGSSGTSTDSGEGATFTWLNNGTGTKAVIKIIIRSGYTAANLIFKPMITLPSYAGPYVPYAKSNRGLTEETDVTLTPDTSNFSIVSYKIKKRDGHVYGYIDAKVVNVSGVSVGTLSEKPSYTWAQAACNSTHRAADNIPTICYVNNQGVIAINPANVFIVDDRIQIAIDFYTSL